MIDVSISPFVLSIFFVSRKDAKTRRRGGTKGGKGEKEENYELRIILLVGNLAKLMQKSTEQRMIGRLILIVINPCQWL